MIRENDMIMISEDEYQSHMDEEFNNGWSQFKNLTLDYIQEQFGIDSEIGKLLLDDIDNLC
jgi:hypothetical protein